jgi:glutathione S-transferase/RNA polymerase-associated protein
MRLVDNAFSPYAFKVRAFLYEKGLPVEAVGLRTAPERDELRRLNPRDEVPALVDGDAVVCDSTTICEYIEDRYPSPRLMPADPTLRARCRTIEAFADGDLDACLYVIGTLRMGEGLAERFEQVVSRAAATLHRHHARLDAELQGCDYFAGDLSVADLAVYPHLRGGAYLGVPVADELPRLNGWMQRMTGRPAIRRAVREMAKAFEEFRTDTDPFFARGRVHWRGERLEWAVRLGLGPWVLEELAAGRAFFSPDP